MARPKYAVKYMPEEIDTYPWAVWHLWHKFIIRMFKTEEEAKQFIETQKEKGL